MPKIQVTLTDEQYNELSNLKHLGKSNSAILQTVFAMYLNDNYLPLKRHEWRGLSE